MGKFLSALLLVAIASGQDCVRPGTDDQHILGIVPNFTTVNDPPKEYRPISAQEKFKLASEDTFDPYSFLITGIYAGVAQWGNNYRQFGQGTQGYGKRYGAALADGTISNYLTEGVLPTLLHEDPRLFRLGTGSMLKRIGYAMSRVLITRADSGRQRFNVSEIAGNMLAASLSNIYYPPLDRSVDSTMEHFAINVVSDAGFNVLKEFWPDMRRKVLHKGDPEPSH
jgi:hypothetical protein